MSNAPVPDGGWGWAVVAASFMAHVIADGCGFSFGVLFSELLEVFGESKSTTAWVGSLFVSVPAICGPIAGMVANSYGCRTTTMVGGLIASLGCFAASYANSVGELCLSFGLVAGFGLSMVFVPAVVVVAFYFEKKRAFATGIAVAGSGIGTTLFAPLTEMLLEEYQWRGTLLIISAIMLNTVACGAVFRPLDSEEVVRRGRNRKATSGEGRNRVDSEKSTENKEEMSVFVGDEMRNGKAQTYAQKVISKLNGFSTRRLFRISEASDGNAEESCESIQKYDTPTKVSTSEDRLYKSEPILYQANSVLFINNSYLNTNPSFLILKDILNVPNVSGNGSPDIVDQASITTLEYSENAMNNYPGLSLNEKYVFTKSLSSLNASSRASQNTRHFAHRRSVCTQKPVSSQKALLCLKAKMPDSGKKIIFQIDHTHTPLQCQSDVDYESNLAENDIFNKKQFNCENKKLNKDNKDYGSCLEKKHHKYSFEGLSNNKKTDNDREIDQCFKKLNKINYESIDDKKALSIKSQNNLVADVPKLPSHHSENNFTNKTKNPKMINEIATNSDIHQSSEDANHKDKEVFCNHQISVVNTSWENVLNGIQKNYNKTHLSESNNTKEIIEEIKNGSYNSISVLNSSSQCIKNVALMSPTVNERIKEPKTKKSKNRLVTKKSNSTAQLHRKQEPQQQKNQQNQQNDQQKQIHQHRSRRKHRSSTQMQTLASKADDLSYSDRCIFMAARQDMVYRGSLLRAGFFSRHHRSASCPEVYSTPNKKSVFRRKKALFCCYNDDNYNNNSDNSDDDNASSKCELSKRCFSDQVFKFIDFSVFKSPVFTLFNIHTILLFLSYDIPYLYGPNRATLCGIEDRNASYLISIIGLFSMFGQVLMGYLGDQPFLNVTIFYNVMTAIAGLFVTCIPLTTSFFSIAAFHAGYGFFISANFVLTTVILVELLGMHRLTNAFGIVSMSQGISNLLGPPLAGWLSDITGSYDLAFYGSGVIIVISGLILFLAPCLEKYDNYNYEEEIEVDAECDNALVKVNTGAFEVDGQELNGGMKI